ncbi:MAG: cysteine desulfurase family protein [Candidatus Krumholzibacteria bacterium]|nr:cysteine desulfurase family protein [Candidatus Krumholzibacteria bacterium]
MSADSNQTRRVYFDHNATTPVRSEVVEAMLPYFRERFGNASSIHFFGQENRDALDRSRESTAALIGADPEEVIFTSGGTESDNLAIRGAVRARRRLGGSSHIVTSDIEHPAVLKTCRDLEGEGCRISYIPCEGSGVVRLDLLDKALTPDTALVSIMLANNETGVIQPIKEISALARSRGVTVHTDAVQGAGKIPVDVGELGVDLLSISAHKFYGPKGVGALYVRRGTPLEPVYTGGSHECGLRPGTENVPGIVGLGEAARIAKKELGREMKHIGGLRDRLERGALERVGDVIVAGGAAPRVPNTSSLVVARIEGEAITLRLSMLGFAISSGSACASGANEPSYVLIALGLDPAIAQGGIRISLGAFNTVDEVDAFLGSFPKVVARLRELSPLK